MYKKAWCTCKVVLLIKPIVFFFTFSLPSASLDFKFPNKGDFSAISLTKRSCGAPTSEVERHISDIVRTVIRTVVKVNNQERGLEPTEKEEKFQEC